MESWLATLDPEAVDWIQWPKSAVDIGEAELTLTNRLQLVMVWADADVANGTVGGRIAVVEKRTKRTSSGANHSGTLRS